MKVGDYVSVRERTIPGIGTFSYGVIASIDMHSDERDFITVIGARGTMPVPLPCSPTTLKVVKLDGPKALLLDRAKVRYDEMMQFVGSA